MTTPMAAKQSPSPNKSNINEIRASSQASNSSQPNNNNNDGNCPNNDDNNIDNNNNNSKKVEEFIVSVASKIAAQPLQYSDPHVWAVLTAISQKARQRPQVLPLSLSLCVCVFGLLSFWSRICGILV